VLVSIDGKTVKRTIAAEDSRGARLLLPYLPQEGIVLLQLTAGRKASEIRVAPALVDALDQQRMIVTADALHTQRALSAQIVAAAGDYVWVVKDDLPTLRTDIAQLFTAAPRTVEGGHLRHDFRTARQMAKGHGRREARRITVCSELQGYSDWPGLAQVFQLERSASKSGTRAHENVYGLTSFTPAAASPARLLALTRAYWGIENGLHYRRDVTFHEDATRLTQGYAGHVMASLSNLVIGLLRLAGFTNPGRRPPLLRRRSGPRARTTVPGASNMRRPWPFHWVRSMILTGCAIVPSSILSA
jgi:predicted transposase YbfD/YdcC